MSDFQTIIRIRIMEPVTEYFETTKAKLKINTVANTKLYVQEPFTRQPLDEPHKVHVRRSSVENFISPSQNRKNYYAHQQINISLIMKEEIFKQPQKDRPAFTEVALVLEDLCNAVEGGQVYGHQPQKEIVNRAVEERTKHQEKEHSEAMEAEKKRRVRLQQLKEKIKTSKEHEEENKAHEDEQSVKPQAAQKKHVDWKQYYEEQLEKVKSKQNGSTIDEATKEKNREEAEEKRKQFSEFNTKQIAELV